MTIRVALFVTSLLGALYSLLSLMGGMGTDAIAGLAVAGVGVAGWTACAIWDEWS